MTLDEAAVALGNQLADLDVTVVADGASGTIQVVGPDPSSFVGRLPLRYQGYPVKAGRGGGATALSGSSTAVAVRPSAVLAAPTPVGGTLVDPDDALWAALEEGRDPLFGQSFDAAVRTSPLAIETLAHQHVHAAFSAALGLRAGLRGSPMGMMQKETWRLRNRALRQVQGTITAAGLADSLARNWEDYSVLLRRQVEAAAAMGQTAAFVAQWSNAVPGITRGFREAHAVLLRAMEAAPTEADRVAWGQAAAVFRAMGSFVLDCLTTGQAPRLPDAGQRALPAPTPALPIEAPVRRRIVG